MPEIIKNKCLFVIYYFNKHSITKSVTIKYFTLEFSTFFINPNPPPSRHTPDQYTRYSK